ncbi:DUF982 domain-containing protein [Rhizobium leguminosarum]|uniref:DUF982 domain-containing protein n=1 Tax=Rhizobium leguminosarum TaxID=384 RepID=UPI003ECF1569
MQTAGIGAWHGSEYFAPLMLVMSGQEKRMMVHSLGEIADALIVWPTDDGAEYIAAVKTCLDAIQGNISAMAARTALIRAAKEAGIPVIAAVH